MRAGGRLTSSRSVVHCDRVARTRQKRDCHWTYLLATVDIHEFLRGVRLDCNLLEKTCRSLSSLWHKVVYTRTARDIFIEEKRKEEGSREDTMDGAATLALARLSGPFTI